MERIDRDRIPYLSHSKVSLYERCPSCYYRQYVLGERDESNAMRLGSLFHDAAREFYTAGLMTLPRLLKRLKLAKLDSESSSKLRNAVTLLYQNRWSEFDVLSVEEPFFIDLHPNLPPVIGVADLILRDSKKLLVVDHKTSAKFNDHDSAQLVLYAEHARRSHRVRRVDGFYDEYRLVANLSTIRKPAFRRSSVAVGRALVTPLIRRYRSAWKEITHLARDGEPVPAFDCWMCRSRWY
jgi:hypothetical protein